jgi:hypothetical protein
MLQPLESNVSIKEITDELKKNDESNLTSVSGCLRIGCCRRHAGLTAKRKQGSEEDYIMRNFVICTD